MKNKNLTIGIDAGKHTGIAIFENNNLIELKSLNTYQTIYFIQQNADRIKCIVIEDSTQQSYIWGADQMNRKSFGRRARNTGSVDGKLDVYKEMCKELKIEVIPISPLKKGKKWTHAEFKVYFPEYKGTTNQHERDAVKCVVVMDFC